MKPAAAAPEAHHCDYGWCRSDRNTVEHWGDGELVIGSDHAAEIERIHCYALVTVDGKVYTDEVILSVQGEDSTLNASLTVDEATRLRDLLDSAIANRAEIRG